MTKLLTVKTAALRWVNAKTALESYVNGQALSGAKIDQARLAELTAAYTTSEQDLERAVAGDKPALAHAVGWAS